MTQTKKIDETYDFMKTMQEIIETYISNLIKKHNIDTDSKELEAANAALDTLFRKLAQAVFLAEGSPKAPNESKYEFLKRIL